MAVYLQSGEIVGIVIVVVVLLSAGIFLCFRCWKSMFEVADAAKRERQSFTRTFRQSIRRSFRRTANRAGEFARRASFRGRAGSINRQRRRRPQMPSHTGGSDLHPYYLQKKEELQHDAPPAYNEAMAFSPVSPTSHQPVINAQTLDVTKLPTTNMSPQVMNADIPMRGQDALSPGRYPQHQANPATSPYRPPQQYPASGGTSHYQPPTPTAPEQNSQQYQTPYNYVSSSQSPSHVQPNTPNQQYTPSGRYATPQYPPKSPASPSGAYTKPQSYDSRKPSTNDDEEDAGFGSRQSRPRVISSSGQDQSYSGGMRDQYDTVYSRPQQSYDQRSPSYDNNPSMKSPVAKDLSRYYNDKPSDVHQSKSGYTPSHFNQGSKDYHDDSRGARDYKDARGQYDNSAYVQESPSAHNRPPPPPQRGYSVDRTQAYKDQYHQDQAYSPRSYNQSASPRSPGYPDMQRDFSRDPGQSPGSAYYNQSNSAVYLQGEGQSYHQADTFI